MQNSRFELNSKKSGVMVFGKRFPPRKLVLKVGLLQVFGARVILGKAYGALGFSWVLGVKTSDVSWRSAVTRQRHTQHNTHTHNTQTQHTHTHTQLAEDHLLSCVGSCMRTF